MEHIVQFAIGIDDEKIRDNITQNAEKTITKNIEQQVRDRLFESSYYGGHADEKSRLNAYSERIIDNFLEKHKDEIVEKASAYLAEKLMRSKVVKEAVAKTVKE